MTNGALRTALYPEIEPYASGMLPLDGIHTMYWETSGNPQGVPVVFLHGGPGSGSTPKHRRFFDPAAYRIVVYDQRGAGRSTPLGELRENTTPHLVADLERLRESLGIERWLVFGGSWGSTLALAYAEAHPARCLGLVLRGIFLCRKSEIDWFLYGLRAIFPEPWERFAGFLPRRSAATSSATTSGGSSTRTRRCTCRPRARGACTKARARRCCRRGRRWTTSRATSSRSASRGWRRITSGTTSSCPENALLANAGRLRGIPGVIVQGRYDVVCPIVSAHELAAAWPEADYQVVPDAGHSAWEPGISAALVAACERFKRC